MEFKTAKFLVCDDSILARKKIKNTLSALGVTNIYEAEDGEQAVEKYKEFNPDIVFMDIVMPKKEGIDALADIMKINPKAKVIMASSVGTQAHLAKAIEIGATNFLQKPIDPSELVKLIEPWFAVGGEK